jgi:hypothetical protein
MRGIRTLLRHSLTGQFYQSTGKWTANPNKARNFRAIDRALNIVHKTHCPNLEIQLSFDNPQQAASFRLEQLFAGN